MNLIPSFEKLSTNGKSPCAGLTLVLIRPGATAFDEQGRIQGDLDLPLSPRGEEQVAALRSELAAMNLRAVYTGPCQSAQQTAAAVAGGARVRIDDDLRNLDRGLWEGKRYEELKSTQPRTYRMWAEHPESVSPPGGETIAAAALRVDRFLERLARRHHGETVGIVAAEPLASILQARFEPCLVDNFWSVERRFGSWNLIQPAATEGPGPDGPRLVPK